MTEKADCLLTLVFPPGLVRQEAALARRLAAYMDRIVKGAQPADLPFEVVVRPELIVNLKTAQEIGVTIPPNVLARADRVMK